MTRSNPLRLVFAALVVGVASLPGPWGGDRYPTAGGAVPGVPGDPVRGARLYRRLDCIRCHTEPRTARGFGIPPSLENAGSRAPASWMATWLLDPEPLRYAANGVRPRIRMPAARVTSAEAQDIAAYLATLRDSASIAANRTPAAADSFRVAAGKSLFGQYQCLGCHRLGGEGGRVGPALDAAGRRRRPEYVMALLKDPNAVVPGTAMRNFDLWNDELRALTSFVMSLRGPEEE